MFHCPAWIRSLLNVNLKPNLTIIETCSISIWKDRECFWIEKLRAEGIDLTNLKNGGDGLELNIIIREKMSAAKRGRPAHNRGQKASLETRAKQSLIAKRRWINRSDKIEVITRMVKGFIAHAKGKPGRKKSEEERAKISRSLIGNRRTFGYRFGPEHNARLSASLMGHPVSEQTRRKIGAANRKAAMLRRQATETPAE